MEKELNIAEILKDKPVGTKLYSPCCGVCTKGNDGSSNRPITLYLPNRVLYHLLGNGKEFETGEIMVYPSKSMRDWSKFAWKKGDVLTDNVSTICMFDSWANDDYTEFNAKYTLHLIASNDAESEVCKTNDFVPVVKDEDKQSYLATAETYFNVNLTKGSLWIEKPQFKDGDIVVVDYVGGATFICICDKVEKDFMYCHARMNSYNKDLYLKKAFLKVNLVNRNPRPATNSEKRQLFSALEKKGKRWDAKKKAIVDLPKKCEFKPKDWCLMKYKGHYNNRGWELCQYAYTEHRVSSCGESRDFYHSVGGAIYAECIPYNDQTAHLLGTNDEWK